MSHAKSFIRVSLILLIVQSVSGKWKPKNTRMEPVCKTPECKTRGEFYKGNMNLDINPCEDFYTFSCGNFRKNQPRPKYVSTWIVNDVMTSALFSKIRDILETHEFPFDGNKYFYQAQFVYKTCVQIPQYPAKKASAIKDEIKRIRHVTGSSLWHMHTEYLNISGKSAFFRTKIVANAPSQGYPLLMLMEPASAFGSIVHKQFWVSQESENYIKFVSRLMKTLKLKDWESGPGIEERINKVFRFRKLLDLIRIKNIAWGPDDPELYTESDLEYWFLDNFRNMGKTQQIPWVQVVEVLLHSVPWQIRQHASIVAIRRKRYFQDLMELLETQTEAVLIDHMEIYFAERHLDRERSFDKKMYEALEGTSIDRKGLGGIYIREKHYPRWQTCLTDLGMHETLEVLVHDYWFPTSYTDIIHPMISRLKDSIESQMRKSDWLDADTRTDIVLKYKRLDEWIGFPPWVVNKWSERPKRPYVKEILMANAWLNIRENLLYILVPLLFSPVFNPSLPALYNYGGIGATIGHELYHAVNPCGEEGKGIWWKTEMRNKCLEKGTLFIETFKEIKKRELKKRYDMTVDFDTSITFTEDFPDVMGLQAAYDAYTQLVNEDPTVCKTLDKFEKYSCDQMFFIAFANGYCSYYTKETAEERLEKKQKHSLESVRVNGGVAQTQSFGTAFNCTVGTPMNPRIKLDMWKK